MATSTGSALNSSSGSDLKKDNIEQKEENQMKIMAFISCVLLISVMTTGEQEKVFPKLKGPYLGQNPPGDEPQLFMPGWVSTNNLDICISFLQGGKVCVFSNNENLVYFTYEKDGQWTKPEKALFPDKKGKTQYTVGPDGQSLYFHSSRPTSPNDKKRDINIWVVKWTGSGWTEPQQLPASVNSDEYHEIYPSTTRNRTLYYFSGWRKDEPLGDTYRSRFINGRYQKAEKLEYPINSEYHEGDPFVASDESCLIFASNRPGGYGFMDLYISFRKDNNSWTHPINLGKKINSHLHVNTVCITLDHKYFFFSSSRTTKMQKGKLITSPLHDRVGDIDLYWVKTDFIDDLKQIALNKKQAAPIIDRDYKKNGLQSAIKKIKELCGSSEDIYHFSVSELLITCGRMIKTGKVKEAEEFYKTLLKILPDKFRIKQGYAAVNILNGQTVKGADLLEKLWSEYPSAKSLQALEPIYSHLRFTKRIEDEIALLRFIAREFPKQYFVFYDLALFFEQTGEIDFAINNCRKSLELNPYFDDAKKLLSKLMLKQKEEDSLILKGPYLGQIPPGMTPEIFAPGIISTGMSETCPAFTPDGKEFYYKIGGAPHGVILFMINTGERWSKPEVVSFSGKYNAEFSMSPDGNTIVLCSNRPLNGSGKPRDHYFCWIVERSGSGWSEPTYMEPVINSGKFAGYPSLSKVDNLYFYAEREGGIGVDDIYWSKNENERFTEPENLGDMINSKFVDADPFIDPEENYLIFCSVGRPDGYGGADLYISFRKKDNSWTKAKNMGKKINSSAWEICPSISSDGKYLFFSSNRKTHNSYSEKPISYEEKIKILKSPGNGSYDIYWVDTKIIEDLNQKK
jgi:Tol biopolymer transport system component